MSFKSYTTCVQPGDYEDPDFDVTAALTILGAIFANPAVVTAAGLQLLEDALEYMLHGKLVCLGEENACAVGTVVGFETVEDKGFPDDVDNDFSINLVLFPNSIDEFVNVPADDGWESAKAGLQGDLIAEQPNMPTPRTPVDGKKYAPYFEHVDPEVAYSLGAWAAGAPPAGDVAVPVMHLEAEGSRISDLLNTLRDIGSMGLPEEFCDIPVIGWAVCVLTRLITAPILLAALVIAWFAAEDGNPDDARTDPEAGELALGDTIVVTGRWVYDAGHGGYNEFHPLKTVQKVDSEYLYWSTVQDWCERVTEVPPPDAGTGAAPEGLTQEQQDVHDAQRRPEHRWVLHPAVDGCLGDEEDNEDQPPIPH